MSSEAGPSNYNQSYGFGSAAPSPTADVPQTPSAATPYTPGSALPFAATAPIMPPPSVSVPSTPTYPLPQPYPSFQQSVRGSKRPRGGSGSRGRGVGRGRGRGARTQADTFPRAGPTSAAGLRRTTRQTTQAQQLTDGSRKVKLKIGGAKGKYRAGYMVETPYGYYDRGLDEDKEEPMVFEEQFILRVPDEVLKGDPAAGVKGLREAVLSRKPIEGVSFKFKDDRRAVFNHGNKSYSAKLVDLPCIIEGQKVLENKRLFKVADISQMLVVGHEISSEYQVTQESLRPEELEWPDGITPPLKDVRRKKWRKRIDLGSDATVVDAVERLIRLDQDAYASNYEFVPSEMLDPEQGVALPIPAETPRDDYIVEPAGETPVEPSPGDSNTLGEEANWADRTARSRGGSYIESEYGDQAGAAREGTVDAEQDIVKRFNERMQREANGEENDDDEHDNLFGSSEEEEEEEGGDEVSEAEEDEEVGIDKEDQELIKQQNKLAEEINDLEDAVKRKRVEVQGKQNRTLRERANIQLQKMIKELDAKRAEHDQIIHKRSSRRDNGASPSAEAAIAGPAHSEQEDKQKNNDEDEDDDSLFGDSDQEEEDPADEVEDVDAIGEIDDGPSLPLVAHADVLGGEQMQADALDAVAAAVQEQTDALQVVQNPPADSRPPSASSEIMAMSTSHSPPPAVLQTLPTGSTQSPAPAMGRTTSQPTAAFDYEFSEPSGSDSDDDDD